MTLGRKHVHVVFICDACLHVATSSALPTPPVHLATYLTPAMHGGGRRVGDFVGASWQWRVAETREDAAWPAGDEGQRRGACRCAGCGLDGPWLWDVASTNTSLRPMLGRQNLGGGLCVECGRPTFSREPNEAAPTPPLPGGRLPIIATGDGQARMPGSVRCRRAAQVRLCQQGGTATDCAR